MQLASVVSITVSSRNNFLYIKKGPIAPMRFYGTFSVLPAQFRNAYMRPFLYVMTSARGIFLKPGRRPVPFCQLSFVLFVPLL